MAKKPGKKQKENPAGCTGEGKQRKGYIGEKKMTVDSAKFKFCDEITRRRCRRGWDEVGKSKAYRVR